jgi:hypothetical protein
MGKNTLALTPNALQLILTILKGNGLQIKQNVVST